MKAIPTLLIVYPPRAGTGLRHAVIAGQPRTLCGANSEDWFMDGSDLKTIGCKRCERICNNMGV